MKKKQSLDGYMMVKKLVLEGCLAEEMGKKHFLDELVKKIIGWQVRRR